jgi:hypothetical protein
LPAFQEGFLSKRRLFFTDNAVAYICEEDAYSESGVELERNNLHYLSNCLPQGNDGGYGNDIDTCISPALKVLSEYTKRDLTHDKDALDGIVGALNTLSTGFKPIYHIWGVPIWPPRTTGLLRPPRFGYNSLWTGFGISWFHEVPCRRRAGFPSWSPLGWQGEMQTLPGRIPAFPYDTIVEVWWNKKYHDLHTLACRAAHLHGLSSMAGSEILRITAQTVAFRKQRIVQTSEPNSTGDIPSIGKWCIQIHVEDGDVVLYSKWDILDEYVGDICCLFSDQLLVLDECEGGFERSGMFDNTGDAEAYVNGETFLDLHEAFPSALRQAAQEQTFLLR